MSICDPMNISESKHQNVRCCLLPRWPLPRLERLAGFQFQVTFKVGGSTFDAVQLDLLWLHFKRVSVGLEVRGRRMSLSHCQDCVDASPGSLYPEVDHLPLCGCLPGVLIPGG